ncbi:hypothetical protein ACHQM5_018179 [Ranunculus cassubicifolius]
MSSLTRLLYRSYSTSISQSTTQTLNSQSRKPATASSKKKISQNSSKNSNNPLNTIDFAPSTESTKTLSAD